MKYETLELTAEVRSKLLGSFVELSDGFVHYELAGPTNGEPVVLMHGFSTPYFAWDNTFLFLAEAGFRVLRYDLYGRGYSARPKVKNTFELFERQLLELLPAVGFGNQKINLVGLSMGGAISTFFTDKHPDLIKRLSLVDQAGFPFPIYGPQKLMTIPGLNRLVFRFMGLKIITKNWTKNFNRPDRFSDFPSKFAEQLQYKGMRDSLFSTMIDMHFNEIGEVYHRVGKLPILKQLFWGHQDGTIPYANSELVRAALPGVEFQTIEDCGHMPQYEQPATFNPLLMQFLKK